MVQSFPDVTFTNTLPLRPQQPSGIIDPYPLRQSSTRPRANDWRAAIRSGRLTTADMNPKSEGILESSLYVSDVAASARFYEQLFGFRRVSEFGERGCAMQAGDRQVLLLFKKGGSLTIESPHDGDGELHLAFAIPASELTIWEAWLAQNRIPIEEKRTWDLGGQSLYFRDPDRHLLELATPGVWSVY